MLQVSTSPWSRRSLLVLLAIVVLACAIRVVLFRGYVGLDDAEYSRLSHQIAEGTFQPGAYQGPAVFPFRVGVTGPTAALFRFFGVNEWTMVLYPMVLSLASILLAYACAAMLFGSVAGLLAASLLAVFPWDIDNATTLLPDLPSAFFMALAVTIVIAVDRGGVRRARVVLLRGLLAGVALGLSWLCKESVSYLAPFCLAAAVVGVRKHGRVMVFLWAGVALGALAILIGEMIVYQSLTGDVMFRFHEIERNYVQNEKYFFGEGTDRGWKPGMAYSQALLWRLFVSGPSVIFLNAGFLFLPLIAVAGIVYAWSRRDETFLMPALWFAVLVLMFNFSSSSTGSYVPLALYDRYLYPIYLPSIVLASGFMVKAMRSWREGPAQPRLNLARWAAVGAATWVLWSGGTQLLLNLRYHSSWTSEVRLLRSTVKPDTVMYADTLTLRALEFFSEYPPATAWTDFEQMTMGNELASGSLVVINSQYIRWLDKRGGIWGSRRSGYRQHAFYSHPPQSWTPIWQKGNVSLYRVEAARRADVQLRGGPES